MDINLIPKQQRLRLIVHSNNMVALLFNIERIDEERLSEEIKKIGEILKNHAGPELLKDFQDMLLSMIPKENRELIDFVQTIDQGDNMTFGEKVKIWEDKKRMEGRMEGEIKGRNEGRSEEKFLIAQNMIKKNMDLKTISDITSVPITKLRKIKKEVLVS